MGTAEEAMPEHEYSGPTTLHEVFDSGPVATSLPMVGDANQTPSQQPLAFPLSAICHLEHLVEENTQLAPPLVLAFCDFLNSTKIGTHHDKLARALQQCAEYHRISNCEPVTRALAHFDKEKERMQRARQSRKRR